MKKLTIVAKNLRKNSTDAERLLWKHLRRKQVEGLKFSRQQPIGNYIVDFVSFENQLIIEADGGQHAGNEQADREREEWLKREGFKILRFWNNDILNNIEGVMATLMEACDNHPPLTPPIKGGEDKW